MKNLSFFLLLTACTVISCNKDITIDKSALMSAKINSAYLNVNNAKAKLEKSNYFNSKGQLTIIGEDDSSRLSIIIKDYEGSEGVLSLNNAEAIAVYTKKSNNVTDTAGSGRLIIQQVISNFYSIPELQASGFATGQVYKSETIAGSFEFITRNNTQVNNGIFGISFNK